jgi:large subunit ribosomal protein L24|nr:ribosomal protein L24 [Meringosphaera mediterranea]
MQKLQIGDRVKVILGKNKGQIGLIKRLFYKKNKAIVEGVNLKIKHVKSDQNQKSGNIVKFEAPIDLSNVMICNEKGSVSRVNFNIDNGVKIRIFKKIKN